MASIPSENTKQQSDREIDEDPVSTSDSDSEELFTPIQASAYTLTLLLGAIKELACELGLKLDIEPNYLFVKALLVSSLEIQAKGIKTVKSQNRAIYEWLYDYLEN